MCKPQRFFYRCTDCLAVSAGEVDIRPSWGREYVPAGVCGACGGEVENMGRVEGERLRDDVERCPCDERCTHAKGPKCSCSCGGANHGSGKVVSVCLDRGPVPTICNPPADSAAKIAGEFRQSLSVLVAERDRINRVRDNSPRGWLDRSDYDRLREVCRVISKAKELRAHSARMKLLRAAADSLCLTALAR